MSPRSPSIRVMIAAASAIVFLFTFTSYGVIRVLGTTGRATIEVEVWRRATQLGDIGGEVIEDAIQLDPATPHIAVASIPYVDHDLGEEFEVNGFRLEVFE